MEAPDVIIGLGHKKRVGKDTFAEYLESALEGCGYDVFKLAFATEMKAMAHTLFDVYGLRNGLHYETCPAHREQTLPGIGKTPRQVWIEFGNAIRDIAPDAWVKQVKKTMRLIRVRSYLMKKKKPTAYIITDVRYPNEAEAIKRWGGTLIRIHRPDIRNSDDVADCALDGYTGWDDYVVNDEGRFDCLKKQADRIGGTLTNRGKCHEQTC